MKQFKVEYKRTEDKVWNTLSFSFKDMVEADKAVKNIELKDKEIGVSFEYRIIDATIEINEVYPDNTGEPFYEVVCNHCDTEFDVVRRYWEAELLVEEHREDCE